LLKNYQLGILHLALRAARFSPPNVPSMRRYPKHPIVRGDEDEDLQWIEPCQLLREDVQIDGARRALHCQALTLKGGGLMVLCKSKIDIGTSRLRQGL
jgi:hypothetical protein